jgi:predicted secreted protein
MTKQTAKHCLLFLGDGGGTPIVSSLISLSVLGSLATLTASEGVITSIGADEGDALSVSGFNDNPDFVGIVKSVTATTIVLAKCVAPDTRLDVVLINESSGDSISVVKETFSPLLGQDTTTYDKSAGNVDTGDKTSGNWDTSLAGSVGMTVNCNGKIEFTNDGKHGGWTKLAESIDDGLGINARLVLNEQMDSYYGPFSITSQGGGGGRNDANGYSFTMGVSGRPVLVVFAEVDDDPDAS